MSSVSCASNCGRMVLCGVRCAEMIGMPLVEAVSGKDTMLRRFDDAAALVGKADNGTRR